MVARAAQVLDVDAGAGAAGREAGGGQGLGGVLGDVVGHRLVAQRLPGAGQVVAWRMGRTSVPWVRRSSAAEAGRRCRRAGAMADDGGGGLADGIAQHGRRRCRAAEAGSPRLGRPGG